MKLGIVIMLVESKINQRAPTYAEIRGMARRAEEGGFDSLWLYDHLIPYTPEAVDRLVRVVKRYHT